VPRPEPVGAQTQSWLSSSPDLRASTEFAHPTGRNDNYGSVLAAHPGSRRGGQLQTMGSRPIVSTAQPRSSRSPRPGTAAKANPATGRNGSMRRSSSPYNRRGPHRSLNLAPPKPSEQRVRAVPHQPPALSGATASADSSTNTSSARETEFAHPTGAKTRSALQIRAFRDRWSRCSNRGRGRSPLIASAIGANTSPLQSAPMHKDRLEYCRRSGDRPSAQKLGSSVWKLRGRRASCTRPGDQRSSCGRNSLPSRAMCRFADRN
jgi:hypothetical protein